MLAFDLQAPGGPRLRYSYVSYVPACQLVSESGLVARRWWLDTDEQLNARPTWFVELEPLAEPLLGLSKQALSLRDRFHQQHQRWPTGDDSDWLAAQPAARLAPDSPEASFLRGAFLFATPGVARPSAPEVAPAPVASAPVVTAPAPAVTPAVTAPPVAPSAPVATPDVAPAATAKRRMVTQTDTSISLTPVAPAPVAPPAPAAPPAAIAPPVSAAPPAAPAVAKATRKPAAKKATATPAAKKAAVAPVATPIAPIATRAAVVDAVFEAPADPGLRRSRGDLLMVLRAHTGATSIYSASQRRMVPLHYP